MHCVMASCCVSNSWRSNAGICSPSVNTVFNVCGIDGDAAVFEATLTGRIGEGLQCGNRGCGEEGGRKMRGGGVMDNICFRQN